MPSMSVRVTTSGTLLVRLQTEQPRFRRCNHHRAQGVVHGPLSDIPGLEKSQVSVRAHMSERHTVRVIPRNELRTSVAKRAVVAVA
jgi:hypothetical protein